MEERGSECADWLAGIPNCSPFSTSRAGPNIAVGAGQRRGSPKGAGWRQLCKHFDGADICIGARGHGCRLGARSSTRRTPGMAHVSATTNPSVTSRASQSTSTVPKLFK
eukprot:scaffold230624_cov32-Tisochrysis_lutea.AAC.3